MTLEPDEPPALADTVAVNQATGDHERTPGPETDLFRRLIHSRLFAGGSDPAKIGRFNVVKRLGAGGMGVVWLAHDEDLDRRVAVKLLRPEVAGDEPGLAAARLRREAQAMAKLRHPNVVAVHEVGEHDGQVFLAMEYVEGTTLGGWLQQRAWSWREIVAQLVLAGRGLQAAHAAGLVHRDFKPDNVLVGDDGRVCVTDFGLARPGESASTEITSDGQDPTQSLYGELAGTPIYMPLECLDGAGASAQSDQFAFCVSLYQALWGRHPFGLSPKVAVATVKHGEPPMAPPRSRVPARIWRLVRQGLAHDPDARHASLEVLLDSLLDDPAARRRRLALVGAAVIGSVTAILVAQRDSDCVDVDAPVRAVWNDDTASSLHTTFAATGLPWADAAAARASESLDAWSSSWAAQAAEACAATHVHGTQSDDLLDRRMVCLDRQRRSLVALLDVLRDADASVVELAPDAVAALPDPVECGDLDALDRMVPHPTDPEQRARVVEVEDAVARGWALYDTGRYADARDVALEAVEAADAIGHRPTQADATRLLADASWDAGDVAAGEDALRRAVALAIAGRDDATAARAWLSLAYGALFGRSDVQEAARIEALASAAVEALGEPEPFRIDVLRLRGQIALAAGRVGEGRRALEEALAALHASDGDPTRLAAGELSVGLALHTAGEFDASREHFEAATRLYAEHLGADNPLTLRARSNLANVLTALRRLDDAKREHEAVLTARERLFGPIHAEVGASLTGLAGIAHYQDRAEEALALQQRALAVFEATLGPDHDHTLAAAENTAAMLSALDRHAEALAIAEQVVATIERTKGAEHPDLAGGLQEVSRALRSLGRNEESRAPIERALAITERSLGADHPHMIGILADRAETAMALESPDAARADLARGIALAEKLFGPDTPRLVRSLRLLAQLDPTRAEALRARADRIDAIE